MPAIQESPDISASDVAKYFLYRSSVDGDLITPLKMQKLVYLAYVKTLVTKKRKLFNEKIEAWPLGPVIPKLYEELSKYGSSPINDEYIDVDSIGTLEKRFPEGVKQILDDVYEENISKSAFELVSLVHEDEAWKKARQGLAPHEPSSNIVSDKDIFSVYG